MKLLTLNTHSLIEPEYEKKLRLFADMVEKEKPDVIALQEVNQTITSPSAEMTIGQGYVPCPGYEGPVRKDNHVLNLAAILRGAGIFYHWTWVPAKLGYDIYEEGMALLSRTPIEEAEQFFISESQSFTNWKTRKAVGVRAGGQWFYSVHMGWWNDDEEPFARHWDVFQERVKIHGENGEPIWIMGDFNSPCDRGGEGYEYVKNSGWQDTYSLAEKKDDGITVGHVIDGWRQEEDRQGKRPSEMRIDYIWCSRRIKVYSSQVVCNGTNYPVVSDHYGVMVVTEGR